MVGFRISDCTSLRAPGRLMRRIDKLMRALVDSRLAEFGVTYTQWSTLKLTADGVVVTASDLAREHGYSSGATTRLIDGLEREGLIERTRGRDDRRLVRLSLTPAGMAMVERGRDLAVGLWNQMLVGISQAEADQFVDTLAKLLATVEARVSDPADPRPSDTDRRADL